MKWCRKRGCHNSTSNGWEGLCYPHFAMQRKPTREEITGSPGSARRFSSPPPSIPDCQERRERTAHSDRAAKKLWKLADEVLGKRNGLDTEPGDWIADAARTIAIAAAIIECDKCSNRNERAYFVVWKWMAKNGYNTSPYWLGRVREKLGLDDEGKLSLVKGRPIPKKRRGDEDLADLA